MIKWNRKVVNQIDKIQTSGVYKLVIEMSSLKAWHLSLWGFYF